MAKKSKPDASPKVSTRHPEKYEYAELLYMQKLSQKDICEKVGITPATLLKWKETGSWEGKRAARAINVDTLVAKTLVKIDQLLDDPDFNADAYSKAVNQLKNLKHRATTDDIITVLAEFGNWLIDQRPLEREIDGDFVKKVTKYQDKYILTKLRNGQNQP